MREGNWVNGTYENACHFSANENVTRDCFDALLNRLSETEFMTDPHSSNLAARCFEIVYRLTEIQDGGAVAIRRTNYATGRLRSLHFWTTNLMRLLASHSDGGESPLRILSSFTPEYRPTGIENTLHCIAWLLKSASSELLSTNHGQRRQLLSILFSSPYQLLQIVLVNMPISIHRADHIGLGAAPSREALSLARVSMAGAAEVVGGYVLIDRANLSLQLASTGNQEEIVTWADLWNASVSWDCASSHLSAGALYLIESAMASSRSSAGEVIGSPGVSFEAFELHQPTNLLRLILVRLLDGGEGGRMKERLMPRVTYNLSRMVLLLSEQLALSSAPPNAANMSTEGSTGETCQFLIQNIISSSSVDLGRPLLSHEKLRTAIFGLSLSIMMTSHSTRNSLYGMMNQFEEAAICIAQIAIPDANRGLLGDSGASERQSAATLAQIALTSMLDLNREEEQFSVLSLLTVPSERGGTRTVIQSVVSLIEALDDMICLVAERVAACRQGPELLLNARLPQALRDAARKYALEEQKITTDFRYRNVSLDAPAFLQGHMSLLRALLLSPTLSANRRGQLASDAMDVLLEYSAVVHRMFSSFPHKAHRLLGCLQCLFLAMEDGGLKRFVSDERSTSWDADVLQLSYHLSQNPFPRRFLPPLPHKLIDSRRKVPLSGNVSITDSNENDPTWWDAIEKGTQKGMESTAVFSGPPSGRAQDFGLHSNTSPVDGAHEENWTVPMYVAALMGAEELDACLSYLGSRATLSPLHSLDGHALASGLCRCADAAKVSVIFFFYIAINATTLSLRLLPFPMVGYPFSA
jgi:hypothetical protein